MSARFICELAVENQIAVPIKERDSYEIYSGYFGKKLRVLGPLDQAMIETIRRQKVHTIEFLPLWVQKDLDLSLLNQLPLLVALTIHSGVPIDWSPIQGLTRLKSLRLRTSGLRPQALDFSRFKALHTCLITWHPEWSSVLQCKTLQHLSLERTRGMPELDLRHLPKLRELSIMECKGLRSLLFTPHQKIESLSVTGTRSFQNLQPLKLLKGLKYLAIGGRVQFDIRLIRHCRLLRKLWLNRIGNIQSLDFLKPCKNLEYIQMLFSTNIQDGNLKMLARFPRLRIVRFENRSHYSDTESEINQLLASK